MENPHSQQATHPHFLPVQVLCAGEALIDLVTAFDGQQEKLTPCLGGSVFNLARALALQGVPTGYLNPLSSDAYGEQLLVALDSAGVRILHVEPVAEPTSLAIARMDAAGKAHYSFYREGVADRHISAADLNQLSAQALRDVDASHLQRPIVCTGCLALSPDDAQAYLPWLAEQKRLGRLIVIDINVRAAVMKDAAAYQATIYQALRYADIIKASDDDLAYLGVSAAQLLANTSAQIFLLTLGAQGAQLLTPEGACLVAPATSGLQVVDTVGAGDCFLGGFLASWLHHNGDFSSQTLQGALHHAVKTACLNVTRQGCQPPTWDEVVALT